MEKTQTAQIPQSVVESLARATLSAMRREDEEPKSPERSGDGKAQKKS